MLRFTLRSVLRVWRASQRHIMNFFRTVPKHFSILTTRSIHAIGVFVHCAILASIVFVVSIGCFPCFAQLQSTTCGGEVWEISTRHLPCSACNVVTPIPFEVHRWSQCRWECSTIEEAAGLTSENGIVPLTILYVHGNFMERGNARERVRIINNYIAKCTSQPYRLLMLSWPSQRDHRIIRNVRDNAQCADSEAYYLASLLQMVTLTSERVSLLGFSFGARAVTGALHLDGGGTLPGSPILPASGEHEPYRVSLVAPAVDRDWLQANGRHRNAMCRVDQLVNLYNSRDPILRRFRFVDSIARPIAAGFAGFEAVGNPRSTEPLIGADRVQQYDCGTQIGSTHYELDYYGECPHFKKAINNLLWKNP